MKETRIYMEVCILPTCLPILWQFIAIIFHIPSYYLPPPADFLRYFTQLMQSGNMELHITATLYKISIGTFWGIILGMILGYLLAKNRLLEHLLIPLFLIIQISPRIFTAPLFILRFGLGLTSKIALVILVVSFPITVTESSALKEINSGYGDLMNILQANRWQIFVRMELPCAFHKVIGDSEVAVAQVITSAVIGEMMGAKAGSDYPLANGAEIYDLNMTLSSMFLPSLLGPLLYKTCQIVEHRALYWE